MLYAFTENFVLPLSHDEVVHGKGSLLDKMPGDDWQKFANLRLLLRLHVGQPGKKLLFMGGEFGQWQRVEPRREPRLAPAAVRRRTRACSSWVRDLNTLYAAEPALHELDYDPAGFEWIDCNDADEQRPQLPAQGQATERRDRWSCCNFTPVPRQDYRVGVPGAGYWTEVLNTDAGGVRRQRTSATTAGCTPSSSRCTASRTRSLNLPPLGASSSRGG